jgi:hypothetical protein
MSEFKRKRETRLPENLRVDYILEGDAVTVFNKIKRENPSCKISDVQDTLNTLNAELEKLSLEAKKDNGTELLNQLESMSLNDEYNDNGTKKKRMNGGMTGMSATALIMYLIADAMREGAKYGYEQITKILAGGLKVLEFLSNKEGCAEVVLRDYLGKRVMLFVQFYYIGDMVNEVANPMNVIIKLVALLPRLIPYVTKGISAGFIGAVGYLVYHFVNHYGTKLSENAKDKVDSLKTTLDALEHAKSEDVVEKVINTSKDMMNKTKEIVAELNKETPLLSEEEKQAFLTKIKEELTRIPEIREGNIEDVMTIEELRASLEPEVTGGKKHKKRKTQKRKNKSNKKTTKKSNKSKKHRK